MESLEQRRLGIIGGYAAGITQKGPMHIFMKECSTGYLHSFHIRALCAECRRSGTQDFIYALWRWADFSLRMQGTYGDPAALNMGYLFEAPGNKPVSWFCADTFDQALALADIASLLEPADSLYIRLLEALIKYENYIMRWNKGEDGCGVGFLDGDEPQKPYHTAASRGVGFYAAMFKLLGKRIYRERGLALVKYVLSKLDMDSTWEGSPLHNRCYSTDSLFGAYHILSDENDFVLRERILAKVRDEIFPWTSEHQTAEGYWPNDRFGNQPGAAPPPVNNKIMSSYSWLMVQGLQLFAHDLLSDSEELRQVLNKAFAYLDGNVVPGDRNRWGYHGWAALAITAKFYPETLFPYGKNI